MPSKVGAFLEIPDNRTWLSILSSARWRRGGGLLTVTTLDLDMPQRLNLGSRPPSRRATGVIFMLSTRAAQSRLGLTLAARACTGMARNSRRALFWRPSLAIQVEVAA